ncbi:hypothetical protein BJ138DRAFT_1103436 [Hygrophoropsis aurantiaca]|uniref:Uncharacterized protein n=1 Tax=Hygrophoropsis aurantiaca TaxID=72124 RepID=A0ACB8A740_9AGAM|nr:hypothetical protein BJ138DRAFT_1103436 [Hygrophoropsis aurantiaca]
MALVSARKQPWPANGGPYRWIQNLETPWLASPAQTIEIGAYQSLKFDGFPWDATLIHDETPFEKKDRRFRERRADRITRSDTRRVKMKAVWKAVKEIFRDEDQPIKGSKNAKFSTTLPFVPADRWKAYGYWARPTVNGVQVHNATPRPLPPINMSPETVWNSLRGPNQSPHAENWPARFSHPALPSRPVEWRTPPPNAPDPFPWELQLNPYLQHRYIGQTLVSFDIGRPPSGGVVFTAAEPASIPLDPADLAQPATVPFVTHMHIVGVADDPAPTFPWPIMVRHQMGGGVTVGDVFETIFRNFTEHVTIEEYNSWSGRRREMAARAYHKRVRMPLEWGAGGGRVEGEIPGEGDGLRRIDYMGEKIMFRGLEPSPLKDGTWLMFVGPP